MRDLFGNLITNANEPKKPGNFKQWQIREGNRIYKEGASVLTNTEILAHLLRDPKAAEELIQRFDNIKNLSEANLTELKSVGGIGPARAEQIQTAFELGRRREQFRSQLKPLIRSPQDVYDLFYSEYRQYQQEVLKVLLLDTQLQLIKTVTVFKGTLDNSLCHPRDIYREALRENACQVILVHNHPSGNPRPSRDDIKATKQLQQAGKITGIPLKDHIILGEQEFVSLKEQGLMEQERGVI